MSKTIFSIGSDSVFTDRNSPTLLADGTIAGDGSLIEGGTDDSRLNTSDLADFGTLSTYSKASESTNDNETSICEGGRVEIIPEKDASILLSDKTDLVETNVKDTISPKKTKSEGDDLYESKYNNLTVTVIRDDYTPTVRGGSVLPRHFIMAFSMLTT